MFVVNYRWECQGDQGNSYSDKKRWWCSQEIEITKESLILIWSKRLQAMYKSAVHSTVTSKTLWIQTFNNPFFKVQTNCLFDRLLPVYLSRAGPGTDLYRPLLQPFVRFCSQKVKIIILLFIANAFLHNWMTHVNFIQYKHIKMYFKIFHPLIIIYWNFLVRACKQNIYTIYTVVYRKRNLQVSEIEISTLYRPGPKQNTKRGRGPEHLGLNDFKTDSFS